MARSAVVLLLCFALFAAASAELSDAAASSPTLHHHGGVMVKPTLRATSWRDAHPAMAKLHPAHSAAKKVQAKPVHHAVAGILPKKTIYVPLRSTYKSRTKKHSKTAAKTSPKKEASTVRHSVVGILPKKVIVVPKRSHQHAYKSKSKVTKPKKAANDDDDDDDEVEVKQKKKSARFLETGSEYHGNKHIDDDDDDDDDDEDERPITFKTPKPMHIPCRIFSKKQNKVITVADSVCLKHKKSWKPQGLVKVRAAHLAPKYQRSLHEEVLAARKQQLERAKRAHHMQALLRAAQQRAANASAKSARAKIAEAKKLVKEAQQMQKQLKHAKKHAKKHAQKHVQKHIAAHHSVMHAHAASAKGTHLSGPYLAQHTFGGDKPAGTSVALKKTGAPTVSAKVLAHIQHLRARRAAQRQHVLAAQARAEAAENDDEDDD